MEFLIGMNIFNLIMLIINYRRKAYGFATVLSALAMVISIITFIAITASPVGG